MSSVTIRIEPVWKSWLRDLVTVGSITAAFYLNHHFMDGDNWLSAFLFLAACIWVIGHAIRLSGAVPRFDTKRQAADWLVADDPPDTPA